MDAAATLETYQDGTLRAFHEALSARDRHAARLHLMAMARWAEFGGSAPSIYRTAWDAYAAMRPLYIHAFPEARLKGEMSPAAV